MTAMAVRIHARNVRSFAEWSPQFLIIFLNSMDGEESHRRAVG
jgi:hypothetical protein